MRLVSFVFLLLSLFASHSSRAQTEVIFAAINYPPFYAEFLPEQGPIIQIVHQAYASQGYQVKTVFIPWVRAMRWSKEGKIDGVIGAWFSQDRAKDFVFSQPIYPNSMLFYKRKDHQIQYQSYQDLKQQGLLMGSVLGYNHPKGLEESGIEILYVTQDTQPFKLLSKGRVDLIVVDEDYARYVLQQTEFRQYAHNIEPMPKVLSRRQQHIIISKQSQQAGQKIKAFNLGLAQLKQQGTLQKILSDAGLDPAYLP